MVFSFKHDRSEVTYALAYRDGGYEPFELETSDIAGFAARDVFGPAAQEALLAADDEAFLGWVLERLRDAVGASHALVGELCGSDWNEVETLAIATANGPVPNFQYSLTGTPCSEVITRTSCVYQSEVAQLFPEDVLLVDMGIESYVGLPLHDVCGRPLGLAVILDQKPMAWAKVQRLLQLLSVVRPRLNACLAARRHGHDLQLLLKGTKSLTYASSFVEIVQNLRRVMMTRGSFFVPMPDPAVTLEPVIVFDGEVIAEASFTLSQPLKSRPSDGETRGAFLLEDAISFSNHPASTDLQKHAMVVPLFGPNDAVVGFAGVCHDTPLNRAITEQPVVHAFAQRLSTLVQQEMFQQQQDLTAKRRHERERLESLGVLAGGVAHDFNNILVGVLGNTEYLLTRPEVSDAPAVSSALSDVRKAAEAANALCRQLMSYARKSEKELVTFNLCSEVIEVSELAKTTLGVACDFEISVSPEPAMITGDPLQIRQVAMNLITNARDAVSSNGRIRADVTTTNTTESSPLRVGSEHLPQGRYAVLSVTDDGHGIPEEILNRIYEPFFTTKESGYGLGLAGVLDVIRSHGGYLDVRTIVGVGTSFRAYFPLVDVPERIEVNVTESAADSKPVAPCLLVIDDDSSIRRLLSRFCSRAGFELLSADGGLAGVELYRQHRETVSLVIVDYAMPELNGLQTIARLNDIDPHVKTVLSSGNVSGVSDIPRLPKPYSFSQFVEVVEDMLGA